MYNTNSFSTTNGNNGEFTFEWVCHQTGVPCASTDDKIDMVCHIDYVISINGNLIGVDVKSDKFSYNGGVGCFEWEVPQELMDRYRERAIYFSNGGINCGWANDYSDKYFDATGFSLAGNYVAFMMPDGIRFLDRSQNRLVDTLWSLWSEKSPDKKLYATPKSTGKTPYIVSCNRNYDHKCLCMYVNYNDLQEKFINFYDLICMFNKKEVSLH